MFELFATPLGWLMHFIYELVPFYFLALVLFTVLVRLVLFPLSIKNQKSQMDRARLAPKLERIQKKYGQDRQKMMQKQQELYEKEGIKMTGGCLPMLLQMLVLFSVIAVIYKPLTYIQSVEEIDIQACVDVVLEEEEDRIRAEVEKDSKIAADKKEAEIKERLEEYTTAQFGGYYRELNLFKAIEKNPELKADMVADIVGRFKTAEQDAEIEKRLKIAKDAAKEAGQEFDEAVWKDENSATIRKEFQISEANMKGYTDYANEVVNTIEKTGKEFSLFGISLLEQPASTGIRPNWLWLIAIASGLSAFFSGKLSMKYSKAAMSAEQQAAGGCSTGMMMWMMPIMSLVFSFTVPAGVAVYWVFSNLLAMVQTVVLNAMYNPAKARALAEKEYAERRQRRKEEKERLRQIHLAEQAAWQQEENEKRAQAKGDITKKKKANTTATPAELPEDTKEEVTETESAEEENANE